MNIQNKPRPRIKHIVHTINVVLMSFIIGVYLSNLAFANYVSTRLYIKKQYLADFAALEMEQRQLAVRVAELRSTTRLSEESKRLNLVKADNVTYLRINGSVALNR